MPHAGIPAMQVGQPGGVAPLDSAGQVPGANLPVHSVSLHGQTQDESGFFAAQTPMIPGDQITLGSVIVFDMAFWELDGKDTFFLDLFINGDIGGLPAGISSAIVTTQLKIHPFPDHALIVWPGGQLLDDLSSRPNPLQVCSAGLSLFVDSGTINLAYAITGYVLKGS